MKYMVGVRSASVGVNSYFVAAAFAVAGAGVQPSGLHPAGGFWRRNAPIIVMTKNTIPKVMNVARHPYVGISQLPPSGPKIAEPPPYPATASPTASPRRSGNHLDMTGIGVA